MLALVIDIRSDLVEGTLVDFPQGVSGKIPAPAPQILYSTAVEIPRKAHTTGDYLTKMMLKGIEDLCLHMNQEAPKLSKEHIHSVHYVLSSPWILSQSKTMHIEYEKDTEVTESMVKNIIEEDRKNLIKTYEPDMIFIEQKIFSVALNGYAVEDYRGKKARTLDVAYVFTLSSDKIIKKIQTAATRILHIKKEFYHSAILLQYLSSRTKMTTDDKEYMLFHIHGELTDLAIIKKGVCAYLGSFPFGVSTFITKLAHSLKSNEETTASTLALYEEDKLEESEKARVKASLIAILKGWESECTDSFKKVGHDVILPHTVHLCLDFPHMNFFKETLESLGFQVVFDDIPLAQLYVSTIKDML